MKKEERFYEKLVLALLLLGTGFLYYNAATAKIVSPDSDMASMDFPKGILTILAVLCIGKIITTCITSAKEHSLDDESRIFVDRRTWMTAISIIIYAILWNVIGFCLSVRDQILQRFDQMIYFLPRLPFRSGCRNTLPHKP